MSNIEKKERLEAQIEKRLLLLKDWNSNGVPSGILLPKSLNQVRLWNLPEFGIEAIGSPGSFTTSHERHGKSVIRIQRLLEKLNSARKERESKPKTNPKSLVRDLRKKLEAQAECLTIAANQFVQEKAMLDHYHRLYRVASQSQKDAQIELDEANEKIQELKSEVVKLRAAKSNKVTNIGFGKEK